MKLNVKLALYVSVLAFLCAGFVSALSYRDMRDSIDRDIYATVESLANTVYNTAAAAVYVENEELALEVIDGLENNDIIHCVKINIFAKNQTIENPRCVVLQNEEEASLEKTLSSPFDNQEILGAIKIYTNNSVINNKTKERAFHEARTVASIIAVTVFMVFYVTYLLVTKPVEILSDKLQKIDFTSTDVVLKESIRNDEIGAIGRVLNDLFRNAAVQIKREKLLVLQTQLITNNFKMTFELSKSPLAVANNQLILISFNAAFRHLFVKDIQTNNDYFVEHWLDWMFDDVVQVSNTLKDTMELNVPRTIEVHIKDTPHVYVSGHIYALTFVKTEDSLNQINYLIFMDDITELKRKLEASERIANQDHLTHLMNRAAGQKAISYALSEREDNETIAVAVLDLDGFKEINDQYGHEAGDQVLRVVAHRIQTVTRSSDVVARWGGDEFVLGLLKVNAIQAQQIGEKIVRAVGEPIIYKGINLHVGVSVGITLNTDRVANFSSLFDIADKAMYEVKKNGKNNVCLLQAS